MRSLLFIPADDDARLTEALESEADAVCLQYEDGAATAKFHAARDRLRAWIAAAKARTRPPLIFARINALDAAQSNAVVEAMLDAVLACGPDGVVLPRCSGAEALQRLGATLAVKEAEQGMADGAIRVIAMAGGTAASIFTLGSYAGASRRLTGLLWSGDDLSAALCPGGDSNDFKGAPPYALARSLTLFAARAAGVLAIDASSREDGDKLRLACEAARREGFDGKQAVDRHQAAIINAVFARGG